MIKRLSTLLFLTSALWFYTNGRNLSLPADSDSIVPDVKLSEVTVTGKRMSQKVREGAFSVNAVDIGSAINRLTNLNELIGRSAGVKIRREGGLGSDYDLSINGLSGNSIRYFIDGVPLDVRGGDVNLDNIPLNTVSRVEIYKGVVPSYLGADALGGAINIITKKGATNYLDASYGYGSFHTQNADINGQYFIPGTVIAIRPTFSLSSSKNDYIMRGVRVWDEEKDTYVNADRRRFHDDYLSIFAGLEGGVTDVRWADYFFIKTSFSKVDKELQTGATQDIVYGMAERRSKAWSASVNYSKKWFDRLSTRLSVSHTWDRSQTIDTAFRKYDWDGNYIPSGRNEISGKGRQWRIYNRPLTVLGAGIGFDFSPSHNLTFDYMLNRRVNDRSDKIDRTYEPSHDVVSKHILSLTYSQNFINERLENIFFVKDYINATSIEPSDYGQITGIYDIEPHSIKSYYGAGIGSKFILKEAIRFKASFEHSVRLPLSRELLGNGSTILPNLALSPEQSNNLNVGVFGDIFKGAGMLTYEVNLFYRHLLNYIRASIYEVDGLMQYRNEPAVRIKGLDFDLTYSWRSRWGASINGSYSDARDMRKYKTDGNPSATYRNRVPNRPWLFANTDLFYNTGEIFKVDDNLRIDLSYSYVHWYFLNWEAYGSNETKPRIPSQNIFNLSLTWSFLNSRYNLSLGCDNIFNRPAYDNYRLQKPGRSFFGKFRIMLK